MPRGSGNAQHRWVDDLYNYYRSGPGRWSLGGGATAIQTGTYFQATSFPAATNSSIRFNILQRDQWAGGAVLGATILYSMSALDPQSDPLPITWQVAEADLAQDLSVATATASNAENIPEPASASQLATYTFTAQPAVDDAALFTAIRFARLNTDNHGGDFYLYGVKIHHYPKH